MFNPTYCQKVSYMYRCPIPHRVLDEIVFRLYCVHEPRVALLESVTFRSNGIQGGWIRLNLLSLLTTNAVTKDPMPPRLPNRVASANGIILEDGFLDGR